MVYTKHLILIKQCHMKNLEDNGKIKEMEEIKMVHYHRDMLIIVNLQATNFKEKFIKILSMYTLFSNIKFHQLANHK